MKKQTPNGTTLESTVSTLVHGAEDRLRQRYSECEEQVRRSPSGALLCAVVFGYILRSLPIAALIGGVVRLLLALLRPVAILLSAAKLFEVVQRETKKRARSNPSLSG